MSDRLLALLPLEGDHRAQALYVLALAVLAVGTLSCLAALRVVRLDVVAVALSCGGAAAWLLSNKPGEGPTLLEVAPGNGVTTADLLVLPAAVLVVVLVRRRWCDG